jgi:hypothetical protein
VRRLQAHGHRLLRREQRAQLLQLAAQALVQPDDILLVAL